MTGDGRGDSFLSENERDPSPVVPENTAAGEQDSPPAPREAPAGPPEAVSPGPASEDGDLPAESEPDTDTGSTPSLTRPASRFRRSIGIDPDPQTSPLGTEWLLSKLVETGEIELPADNDTFDVPGAVPPAGAAELPTAELPTAELPTVDEAATDPVPAADPEPENAEPAAEHPEPAAENSELAEDSEPAESAATVAISVVGEEAPEVPEAPEASPAPSVDVDVDVDVDVVETELVEQIEAVEAVEAVEPSSEESVGSADHADPRPDTEPIVSIEPAPEHTVVLPVVSPSPVEHLEPAISGPERPLSFDAPAPAPAPEPDQGESASFERTEAGPIPIIAAPAAAAQRETGEFPGDETQPTPSFPGSLPTVNVSDEQLAAEIAASSAAALARWTRPGAEDTGGAGSAPNPLDESAEIVLEPEEVHEEYRDPDADLTSADNPSDSQPWSARLDVLPEQAAPRAARAAADAVEDPVAPLGVAGAAPVPGLGETGAMPFSWSLAPNDALDPVMHPESIDAVPAPAPAESPVPRVEPATVRIEAAQAQASADPGDATPGREIEGDHEAEIEAENEPEAPTVSAADTAPSIFDLPPAPAPAPAASVELEQITGEIPLIEVAPLTSEIAFIPATGPIDVGLLAAAAEAEAQSRALAEDAARARLEAETPAADAETPAGNDPAGADLADPGFTRTPAAGTARPVIVASPDAATPPAGSPAEAVAAAATGLTARTTDTTSEGADPGPVRLGAASPDSPRRTHPGAGDSGAGGTGGGDGGGPEDPDMASPDWSPRRLAVVASITVAAMIAVYAIGSLVVGMAGSGPETEPAPTSSAAESATPSAEPSAAATPGTLGERAWETLGAGECLSEYTDAWAETFTVVPCAEPHAAQLASIIAIPEAEVFPGEAALAAGSALACSGPSAIDTAAAAGIPDLQVQASYPVTAEQWDAGQRSYQCFVSRSGGEALTGDLAPALAPSAG